MRLWILLGAVCAIAATATITEEKLRLSQDDPGVWLMYGKNGAPAKQAILAARDRILSRHPKLRVIGCHLGSSEQDLSQVAKRLDAFPNYAVDVASRVIL